MKILNQGVQYGLLNESPTAAGSVEANVAIQSDAVLVTLFAASVSGTLDVSVYSIIHVAENEHKALLLSFPQLSASTASLVIKRSSITTANLQVEVSYSDACTYEVQVRAVSSGSSDTKLLGADTLQMSQKTVTSTAVALLPTVLTDRSGVVIKNWSVGTDIFVAETPAKATPALGYPLAGRDAIAVDISAGSTLYASTSSGTADIRIAETGS